MGKRSITLFFALAVVLLLGLLMFAPSLWAEVQRWFGLITDREWIRATIQSYGWAAPLVFIGVQIAQVIAAPVPGEATGFIGGYLFGSLLGFIYSSIGLTTGSLINFGIGRFLGERFAGGSSRRRNSSASTAWSTDRGSLPYFYVCHPGVSQGLSQPGSGLTTLPLKVFAILACIGRMPGTLLLSLQGHRFTTKTMLCWRSSPASVWCSSCWRIATGKRFTGGLRA